MPIRLARSKAKRSGDALAAISVAAAEWTHRSLMCPCFTVAACYCYKLYGPSVMSRTNAALNDWDTNSGKSVKGCKAAHC